MKISKEEAKAIVDFIESNTLNQNIEFDSLLLKSAYNKLKSIRK